MSAPSVSVGTVSEAPGGPTTRQETRCSPSTKTVLVSEPLTSARRSETAVGESIRREKFSVG